ncbi:MAG: tRNA dihydrouridine synthase DusB, partial [Bacteroidota bacterium]|nr:tRNA dihydrouridine synthase DusB [Bacteroidota bacterium]
EDITDSPFRQICKNFGANLMFSEFISSEGLIRDAEKSTEKLFFEESERPIGIQIFGHDVESVRKAALMAEQTKPDIIDLNYGCPVKKVVNKGAGSALLKEPEKMIRMTEEVVKSTSIPVTVKTRLGWSSSTKNIVELAERLQDTGIKALTIHGRTRDQLYGGKADWTLIGEIKNNHRINIPIIGNGDIDSPQKALEAIKAYNVDGIMIGRASIGNPWIFRNIRHYIKTGELLPPPELNERAEICLQQFLLSLKLKKINIAIFEMRKHYSNYFKGIPNFKEIKMKLITCDSENEIIDILNHIIDSNH